MSNDTWIIVPAYNEAKVIAKVIKSLLNHFSNVLVIDDSSQDDTFIVARAAGAIVIRHSVNLGQGASIQTGVDYSLSKGATTLVTYDADGQHRVEDVIAMLSMLDEKKLDIVLGSRFKDLKSIGMPTSRYYLLKLAVLFTRITSGMHVTDAHNGLRVMTASAARKFDIQQNRMAHASEINSIIKLNNLKYIECPIVVQYTDYSLQKGQRLTGALQIIIDLILLRI